VYAEDDLITVFEKASLLTGFESNWLLPSSGCFEQASEAGCLRRGDRARTEEIRRLKIAAIRGVVSYELRYVQYMLRVLLRTTTRWGGSPFSRGLGARRSTSRSRSSAPSR